MNVLFVYPDFMKGAQGKYYEGLASLSALLKKHGHRVELLHIVDEISAEGVVNSICSDYPHAQLVGFSATTNAFSAVGDYARILRQKKRVPTICGGVHPTLCPDESIAQNGIDMICRGEGEYPLLELCNKLSHNEDISDIKSLWIKKDQTVLKNPLCEGIKDLDCLPMPDRALFDYKKSVDYRWRRLVFMASRGCPYSCAHCCNEKIRDVYPQGSFRVRFKSVEKIISEIEEELRRWPHTCEIHFHDDILPINKEWFMRFTESYRKRVALPYICNSRFELIDKEVIRLLKMSGCIGLKVGLESGNDYIRKEVLKRKQEHSHMIDVAHMCHNQGLALYTFNMLGMPFEDLKKALDTVKLNAELKPREIQVTIFYPYPKTELHTIAQEKGFLTNKKLSGYATADTVLKLDAFSHEEIIFAFKNFLYFVRDYQFALRLPDLFKNMCIKLFDFLWLHPNIAGLFTWAHWLISCCVRLHKRIVSKVKRTFSQCRKK